jgi:hypothetical protein
MEKSARDRLQRIHPNEQTSLSQFHHIITCRKCLHYNNIILLEGKQNCLFCRNPLFLSQKKENIK